MDGQITLPMKLGVEFVGTIFFLSVIVSTGNWAAIGGALALCAFLGGGISGGHFNPAVTFMFYMKEAISLPDAALYIMAQLAGALVALAAYQNLVVKRIANSR
jgi:glycerol uptake facilitator-like aquaporin